MTARLARVSRRAWLAELAANGAGAALCASGMGWTVGAAGELLASEPDPRDPTPRRPPITALVVAPDGSMVLAGSQAGLTALAFDERGERIERRAEHDPAASGAWRTELEQIHDLAFSPEGKWLAAAGGTPGELGELEIFAWPSGRREVRRELHDDVIYAVRWGSGARELATAGGDGVVAWQADWRESQVARWTAHSRTVLALEYLPTTRQFVSASADETLRVWDGVSGKVARQLSQHTRPVLGLAARPTASKPGASAAAPYLASIGEDRTVRLWQPTIGRMVRFARLAAIPQAVEWTAAGDALVVGLRDGRCLRIDPDTMEEKGETPRVDSAIYCLARGAGDSWFLAGARGLARRFDWPRE